MVPGSHVVLGGSQVVLGGEPTWSWGRATWSWDRELRALVLQCRTGRTYILCVMYKFILYITLNYPLRDPTVSEIIEASHSP